MESEPLLSFSEAAALIPSRPSVCTLWRWARKGVQGIRLEVRRYGYKFYTTRTALDEFSKRLAELPLASDAPARPPLTVKPPRRSEADRKRAIAAARAELES